MSNQLAKKRTQVDLRQLKTFAFERLAVGSPLRDVLLTEQDAMPAEEFVHKLSVWLKLLKR